VTFHVSSTRLSFLTEHPLAGTNVLRGALGAMLHRTDDLYGRWFDPHWQAGPSGYRNAPRPFVLRRVLGGKRPAVDLITFAKCMERELVERQFRQALQRAGAASDVETITAAEMELPVCNGEGEGLLRIEFVTPTELKTEGKIASRPHFAVLVARLAERVQALGACYQQWPADMSFRTLLEGAREVEMRACSWEPVQGERRRSARSGQVHELRGYTGWAEYEGPIGRFLPLLEIGCWTGVGRNTVWGHGELRVGTGRWQ
jgi:hypothetical protein